MRKQEAIDALKEVLRIAQELADEQTTIKPYNYALGRVRGIQIAINTLEGME